MSFSLFYSHSQERLRETTASDDEDLGIRGGSMQELMGALSTAEADSDYHSALETIG